MITFTFAGCGRERGNRLLPSVNNVRYVDGVLASPCESRRGSSRDGKSTKIPAARDITRYTPRSATRRRGTLLKRADIDDCLNSIVFRRTFLSRLLLQLILSLRLN